MSDKDKQTHATAVEYIRKNQNTGNDLCREDEFIAALLEVVDAQAVEIKLLRGVVKEYWNSTPDDPPVVSVLAKNIRALEEFDRRGT